MLLETVKLIIGLFLAIKGADVLISSSIGLGRKFKVSDFFIGLVIVGFGTSIPELLVSVDAVLNNSANLSVGNILGSNIANILLVFSALGFVNNIKIKDVAPFDMLFHLSMHVIFYLVFNFSTFGKKFGVLFIILFLFYIFLSLRVSKDKKQIDNTDENDFFSAFTFRKPIYFSLPILIISIALTLFGVDLAVNSAVFISNELNIPDSFIGLSLIAIGTSLPELVTSISAAKRGNYQIIFGNIIGSNIYNLLFILGVSSLFKFFGYNFYVLKTDVLILLITVFIFSICLIKKLTINKKISLIFLAAYILYLINLYYRNF
jgi:cation:H+ antiporter